MSTVSERQGPEGALGAGDEVRTVAFVSLGCPKNLVDSEKMLGLLAEDGIRPVALSRGEAVEHSESGHDAASMEPAAPPADFGGADAVVVNTCGFLEASKQESLGVIREAVRRKEAGELKRVVVAGCLVQRHRAKMLEWEPGIDALVGVFDRDHIVRAVRGTRAARETVGEERPPYWIAANGLAAARERGIETVGLTVHGKDGKGVGYFESDAARLRLTPRHYAFLRISEGCNQACAFCTIPSIRGKMRSKGPEAVAAEARELLEDGAFELNLIGQDTTSYGDDIGRGYRGGAGGGGLPELLRTLNDAVDEHAGGNGWVRLMYAYPSTFEDGMIDAIGALPNVVKYIDIPLQHASDRMLSLMRRNVSAAQQRELIERLRERVPGMAVRTTFITGFPGETEADHEELLRFVDEVGFDAVGVFEYSREPGTPAGTMDADADLHVPAEVKRRRKGEIMALQQEIAFEQAAFVAEAFDPTRPAETGNRFDVLIDAEVEGGVVASGGPALPEGLRLYRGRCYFQAVDIDSVTYVATSGRLSPGELVRCTVVASDGYDLVARPVDELTGRVALPVIG